MQASHRHIKLHVPLATLAVSSSACRARDVASSRARAALAASSSAASLATSFPSLAAAPAAERARTGYERDTAVFGLLREEWRGEAER